MSKSKKTSQKKIPAKPKYELEIDRKIVGYTATPSPNASPVKDQKGGIIVAATIEEMEKYCAALTPKREFSTAPFLYGDFIAHLDKGSIFCLGESTYEKYCNAEDSRPVPYTVYIEEAKGIRLQPIALSGYRDSRWGYRSRKRAIVGYHGYSAERFEAVKIKGSKIAVFGSHEDAYRIMRDLNGDINKIELLTSNDIFGRLEAGDILHLDEYAYQNFQYCRHANRCRQAIIALKSDYPCVPCVSIQAAHPSLVRPDWPDTSRHIGYYGTDYVTYMTVVDRTGACVLAESRTGWRRWSAETRYMTGATPNALNFGQVMDAMVSGVRFLMDPDVTREMQDVVKYGEHFGPVENYIKYEDEEDGWFYWWFDDNDEEDGKSKPPVNVGV